MKREKASSSGRVREKTTGSGGHVPREAVLATDAEDMREALVRRVAEECGQTFVAALCSGPDVATLHRVMDEMYADLERILTKEPFDPPLACARGCSYCCYNQISLTPPEALHLGLYVLERYRGEEAEALARRVDDVLRRIRGKSRAELGTMRHELPCPFLEDGACAVHPARPLVCRGWNSVNAEQCRRANVNADPMTMIENHALPRELAEAMQLGLLRGSQACGKEAGFLVITRAVKLMQEFGLTECARAWLAGEPFFARQHPW